MSDWKRKKEELWKTGKSVKRQIVSASGSNDLLCCPHCDKPLKYLMTWFYEANCPPQGYDAKCDECGGAISASPKTTFIVKAI